MFRSHLRDRWPDYPERMKALHASARDSGDPTHLLGGFADSAAASLTRLRETIVTSRSRPRDRCCSAAAQTIYLDRPAARLFGRRIISSYALAQLGVRAMLVDNVGSLGAEQMANATPHDALIAISFAPYTPFTIDLARKARERRDADRGHHRQPAQPARPVSPTCASKSPRAISARSARWRRHSAWRSRWRWRWRTSGRRALRRRR